MIMYGAVLPSYNGRRNDRQGDRQGDRQQEVVKADDPRNRDKVRRILEQYD